MRTRVLLRCLVSLTVLSLLTAGAQAGGLFEPSKAPRTGKSKASSAAKVRHKVHAAPDAKFIPATAQQVDENRKRGLELYEKARKYAPSMHIVETQHFMIYSCWQRKNDRELAQKSEQIYASLARQFGIDRNQSIWAGKCPLFVFEKASDFKSFTRNVDGANLDQAGGYQYQDDGGFTYIVLSRAHSGQRFYEILTHETTHAFAARYISNRALPMWVNEGLAEYMAATLVKGGATQRYVQATRQAIRKNRNVSRVLDKVELTEFDYGIAQSFVRFLLLKDRQAFAKFVIYLKEGKSEADALKRAYKMDRQGLLKAWAKAAAQGRI